MSTDEPNLKSEIVDEIGLNVVSKFFHTIQFLILNPKVVIESIHNRETRFVRPLRFALSIATPVVLILAVWKPDFSNYVDKIVQDVTSQGDVGQPMVIFGSKIYGDVYSGFYSEYFPLINVVFVAPIVAFIFRVLYKTANQSGFFYFYSVALYITGLTSLLDLIFAIIKYALNWATQLSDIPGAVIDIALFVYLAYRIFSVPYGILKAFTAYLFQAIVVATVMLFSMFLVGFLRWDEFSYKPALAIGICTKDINSDFVEEYHLTQTKGLVTVYVQPNSPAEVAGIKPGDIILKVKNKLIRSNQDFQIGMDSTKDKEPWTVEVLRGDEVEIIEVTPMPFEKVFLNNQIQFGWTFKVQKIAGQPKLIITEIDNGHTAQKAGLLPGDEIVSINGSPRELIKSSFYRASYLYPSMRPGDMAHVEVLRAGQLLEFPVAVEEKNPNDRSFIDRVFEFHH